MKFANAALILSLVAAVTAAPLSQPRDIAVPSLMPRGGPGLDEFIVDDTPPPPQDSKFDPNVPFRHTQIAKPVRQNTRIPVVPKPKVTVPVSEDVSAPAPFDPKIPFRHTEIAKPVSQNTRRIQNGAAAKVTPPITKKIN